MESMALVKIKALYIWGGHGIDELLVYLLVIGLGQGGRPIHDPSKRWPKHVRCRADQYVLDWLKLAEKISQS